MGAKIQDVKEQIQEDIITYVDATHHDFPEQIKDDLCQIVVDNFAKIEYK